MRNQIVNIYFGMNNKDGGRVEDADFNSFCYKVVCPLYDSFTIQKGMGVWKKDFEHCRIITLVLPYDEEPTKVNDICFKYCEEFDQESVLVTVSQGEAVLYESTVNQWKEK